MYLKEHPLVVAGAQATLADHLQLVDDRLVEDVDALTRLFIETQPELVGACARTDPAVQNAVVSNPTFDLSDDLGGADADLIVAGALLELKVVATAVLNKPIIWQVLGHLLADTNDRHHISAVGWYFARHGYLWQLPADEFLTRLHGGPIILAAARTDFAAVLASI